MDEKAQKFALGLRGQLIMAKALAYAMSAIDALPVERQEWSDRQDMAYMLGECFSAFAEMAAQSVAHHTGKPLDITDYKAKDEPHPISGFIIPRSAPRDVRGPV